MSQSPRARLEITRTVTLTKTVTVDEWSYPNRTPQQAKGYEEVRHVTNRANHDTVLYEFSDDIKFAKPEDIKIHTEVKIIDAPTSASPEEVPVSDVPLDAADDEGQLRDAT